MVDTILKGTSVNNETQLIFHIKNSSINVEVNTNILQTDNNSFLAPIKFIVDNSDILISNAGFSNFLCSEKSRLGETVWIRKCNVKYSGDGQLVTSYYNNPSAIYKFHYANNNTEKIDFSSADKTKLITYDPDVESLEEPNSNNYVKLRQQIYNTSPEVGGYMGWVCITPGIANTISWVASKSYDYNTFVNSNGNVYRSIISGTSSTTSPSHTSGTATDGTVTWMYIGKKAAFKQYGQIEA
ncbi:hypothetical protein D3C84_729600 [compost metagenome]